MSGHGHVTPNADGSRARCGGPGFCDACSRELALHQAAKLDAEMRPRADTIAEDAAADAEADERYREKARARLPHHMMDVRAGDVVRWGEEIIALRARAEAAEAGASNACAGFTPAMQAVQDVRDVLGAEVGEDVADAARRVVRTRDEAEQSLREVRWQLVEMTGASNAGIRERNEALAEVARLRGIIADARYCIDEDVGPTALRATLKGNGLEPGVAEELKSDLDRLRDEVASLAGAAFNEHERAALLVQELRGALGAELGEDVTDAARRIRAQLAAADALRYDVERLGNNAIGWSTVQARIDAYDAARGTRAPVDVHLPARALEIVRSMGLDASGFSKLLLAMREFERDLRTSLGRAYHHADVERLCALAIKHVEISTGKAAEILGVDRLRVREILEEHDITIDEEP